MSVCTTLENPSDLTLKDIPLLLGFKISRRIGIRCNPLLRFKDAAKTNSQNTRIHLPTAILTIFVGEYGDFIFQPIDRNE